MRGGAKATICIQIAWDAMQMTDVMQMYALLGGGPGPSPHQVGDQVLGRAHLSPWGPLPSAICSLPLQLPKFPSPPVPFFSFFLSFFFFFFFLSSCLFRAAATAYGGSQARDRIGAVTVNVLHHSHSNEGSLINPLGEAMSEARDRTCVLMVASPVC